MQLDQNGVEDNTTAEDVTPKTMAIFELLDYIVNRVSGVRADTSWFPCSVNFIPATSGFAAQNIFRSICGFCQPMSEEERDRKSKPDGAGQRPLLQASRGHGGRHRICQMGSIGYRNVTISE